MRPMTLPDSFIEANDGGTHWAVVFGGSYYTYKDEGERGLQEFNDRGGYCYGEDPDGEEDHRDIEV